MLFFDMFRDLEKEISDLVQATHVSANAVVQLRCYGIGALLKGVT